MIGRSGNRESGISVMAAPHNDDDDDDDDIYIYMYIYIGSKLLSRQVLLNTTDSIFFYDLQVKIFKSYYYSSYLRVEMVKKYKTQL